MHTIATPDHIELADSLPRCRPIGLDAGAEPVLAQELRQHGGG